MKKMTIRKMLFTCFIILAVLSLMIGSIGIYSISEMNQRDQGMFDYAPVVYSLGIMMEYYQKINADLYQLAIYCHYEDADRIDAINENIEYCIARIKAAKDEYLRTSLDKETETNFYEILTIYESDYLPFVRNAQSALLETTDLREAVDIILTGKHIYERIEDLLNASIDDNIGWQFNDIRANENVARVALLLQTGAILVSLVIALFFAFYLSGRIGKMSETIEAQAEHIENENERMKILLDTSPMSCRLFNKNYEIFECNEASTELFQLNDKQEFMAQYYHFSPIHQPDGQSSKEKAKEMLDRAFAGEVIVTEWMHQLPDGTLLPCEVTLKRAKIGNEDVIAGYTRDLREQKRMMDELRETTEKLEEALVETQRANDAKSDFLANMSHEMRTPLNAIIGLSGLSLENSDSDGEKCIYLEKINNAGEMLLNIVNDILDISKIEAGRMELIEVEYDVPSLINDTVTQNIFRIGEKPIEFTLDVGEDVFSRLNGDELRVKQIMNNLLSNAIKYTEEGFVELSVHCEQEGQYVWVTIKVTDSGTGIRREDMSELYKDYSQIDSKSNRKIEGTGLGLSITKNLAEMMLGTIDVESEYGKGSTFKVRIAQNFVSDVHIGREVVDSLKGFRYSDEKRGRNAQLKRISLPYARVLVVDDSITNLDVSKGLMKPYGMHIDCVTSGQQAIDAIRDDSVQYNAIFMDHMMPVMDGIEATRIIREEIGTEYAKNIPIIALTANAIAGNESMFLRKGFQAFLSKPVEIARLDEIIRRWVRDKEQEKTDDGQQEVQKKTDENEPLRRMLLDFQIPGLDIYGGIKRLGGSESAYLGVLRSFSENTRLLVEQMKTVNEDTLADYSIIVHGIKGSSRSICAVSAGELAEELERTSKAGDFESVSKNNMGLVRYLEDLIDEIEKMLQSIDAKKLKPKKEKPDMELLRELLIACEHYDTDGIDDIITELNSYEYSSGGGLITELTRNANQYDFKKNTDALTSLFDKGEIGHE